MSKQYRGSTSSDSDVETEPMLEWQPTAKPTWDRHRRSCCVVATALFLSFCGFFVMYFVAIHSGSVMTSSDSPKLAEEVNGLIPEFPLTPQIWSNYSDFGPEKDLHEMSSDEVDTLLRRWKHLIPSGGGFVPVHEPEKHTLPPPLKYDGLAPPDYYYAISWSHQLHCLDAILQSYVQAKLAGKAPSTHSHETRQAWSHSRHILHCFDYLRQAIQCCGDTALEGADEYSIAEGRDSVLIGTSGIGSTHMCKNHDDLVKYAEDHANPKWKKKGPLNHDHNGPETSSRG